MVRATDIAWAAGLFEGEGSITTFRPKRRPHSIRIGLSLVSTDRDVIERFCDIVGRSHVTELKRATKKNKRVYRWQTQATKDVRHVLALLSPYFCARRTARTNEVLAERKAYEDGNNSDRH